MSLSAKRFFTGFIVSYLIEVNEQLRSMPLHASKFLGHIRSKIPPPGLPTVYEKIL